MARLLPAELAALAAGVSTSTIRVWRHRGLLKPAGGTARRPLYDPADLYSAKQAPKPRLAKEKAHVAG
jgi:DNA-binding transcriptional MerR regulator